jgi:hypothetical protein
MAATEEFWNRFQRHPARKTGGSTALGRSFVLNKMTSRGFNRLRLSDAMETHPVGQEAHLKKLVVNSRQDPSLRELVRKTSFHVITSGRSVA